MKLNLQRYAKNRSERRRAQQASYRLKVDRAAQWVKQKLLEAVHAKTALGPPWCALCGHHGDETNPLCVDHIDGKKWHVRSANQIVRLLRYIAEFQADVPLRVLCKKCNEKDGAKQRARGHRVKHHSKVPLPSAPREATREEMMNAKPGIVYYVPPQLAKSIEQALALFDAVDTSLEALSGI